VSTGVGLPYLMFNLYIAARDYFYNNYVTCDRWLCHYHVEHDNVGEKWKKGKQVTNNKQCKKN